MTAKHSTQKKATVQKPHSESDDSNDDDDDDGPSNQRKAKSPALNSKVFIFTSCL